MGILWEEANPAVFLLLSVLLGGAAAYLTGRAMALTWRPIWSLVVYMLILAAAVRFFHYALFGGSFFFYFEGESLRPGIGFYYYVVDLIVLLIAAGLGYRITRAGQMVTQYPWLYSRVGPLAWRRRSEAGAPSGQP